MKKRTDYTFKYNSYGRYNWLRLTPAYSIKLVDELLPSDSSLFGVASNHNLEVLDPFSGTATTGIVVAEKGFNCTLFDINPFLIWFGKTKTANYNHGEVDALIEEVRNGLPNVNIKEDAWIPPMFKIERWWAPETLASLSSLRDYISKKWGEPTLNGVHNLLWVAFANLIIKTSAADFNHVSVSFKEKAESKGLDIVKSLFWDLLTDIAESAKVDIPGQITFVEGDSRLMETNRHFDLVITSPPYPNRISYIRELRPYMYWLKFLSSGEEAGELDWKAIGGTWGSATSKLLTWSKTDSVLSNDLLDICDKIAMADSKNGRAMSLYVLKFFDDMFVHLSNLREHLNNGARVNYILGNSSFYGIMVDTESYIVDMFEKLGYKDVSSSVIRKRNSKSCLYEYLISASWEDNFLEVLNKNEEFRTR